MTKPSFKGGREYSKSGNDVVITCFSFKEAEALSNILLDETATLKKRLQVTDLTPNTLGGTERSGWYVRVHSGNRALQTLEVEQAVNAALAQRK